MIDTTDLIVIGLFLILVVIALHVQATKHNSDEISEPKMLGPMTETIAFHQTEDDMGERKTYEVKIYKAKDGWRWRSKAGNGRKVACSGEAFSDKTEARRAAIRMTKAKFVFVDEPEKESK